MIAQIKNGRMQLWSNNLFKQFAHQEKLTMKNDSINLDNAQMNIKNN